MKSDEFRFTTFKYRLVYTSDTLCTRYRWGHQFYNEIDTLLPIVIHIMDETKLLWFTPHPAIYKALPERYSYLQGIYGQLICLKKKNPKRQYNHCKRQVVWWIDRDCFRRGQASCKIRAPPMSTISSNSATVHSPMTNSSASKMAFLRHIAGNIFFLIRLIDWRNCRKVSRGAYHSFRLRAPPYWLIIRLEIRSEQNACPAEARRRSSRPSRHN